MGHNDVNFELGGFPKTGQIRRPTTDNIDMYVSLLTGAIARSVAMSPGNQEAPRSIRVSGTSFREGLVIKIYLRSFFLFRCFKKSICQLMAKRCALSTGNLFRGGVPRNSEGRITDRPDVTSAVYRGGKASAQTNKQV